MFMHNGPYPNLALMRGSIYPSVHITPSKNNYINLKAPGKKNDCFSEYPEFPFGTSTAYSIEV